MIRSFTGKPLIGDINISPENIANLKVVNDYCTVNGHHVSFVFKDKIYTLDIAVFQPNECEVKDITPQSIIQNGGF
jgi:hypothetical protein